MSDTAIDFTTRKVATRTPEAQEQIDAAHKMPGSADPGAATQPVVTPEAGAAREPVKGRPGIPGTLPGTTWGPKR